MHSCKSVWHLEFDFSILLPLHLLQSILGEITEEAALATYWKNAGYRCYKEHYLVENP